MPLASSRPGPQQDLRKNGPIDLPEQEAAQGIWRTSEVLAADFDHLFKDHGLTTPQYNALRILRGEGRPVPCQSIGPLMFNRQSDVTRLLERLERAGHVRRTRSTGDRRVVLAEITAKGLAKLGGLDEPVRDLHRAQLQHMSATDIRRLNELLALVRGGAKPTM